jgi:hypothetical protein
MINVLTKDGRLNRKTEYTIRTYANMGVDIEQTLRKALSELKQKQLLETVFGKEVQVVDGKVQTTKDRINALEQILSAL